MALDITAAHIFYIPAVLTVGGAIGFFLGKRWADKQAAEHAARSKEQGGGAADRARRRAERRRADGDAVDEG